MAPLNVVLVGHRGTGKTSFLRRLRAHGSGRDLYDLDEEIARAAGRRVSTIFARDGEAAFREIERRVLDELLARPRPKVIAVGAGYDGPRPDAAFILWLKRTTDAAGRAFVDRPRLAADRSPLAEYLDRFAAREARYRAWADQTLLLPEGYEGGLEDVVDGTWRVPFDITLDARDLEGWSAFWARREAWGLRRLEARDDLVDPARVPVRTLRAYRSPGANSTPGYVEEDWALELGSPPRRFEIVSVHEGSLDAAIERLAPFANSVQKLSVEISTFDELRAGHRWWRELPHARAFLPRSPRGRWRWYRSLFGPSMPLHFVREDGGSAPDQPPLWQALLQTPFRGRFAAVLGAPVEHSRTPMEQRDFFAARNIPVVAVELDLAEWSAGWRVLREFGLEYAAVTAPLKQVAFESCDERTPEAARTGSVNTLHVDGARTHGANTDILALHRWREEIGSHARVWLWGGGGVKSSVREVWPHAREISARRGVVAVDASAELSREESSSPDLLIWAVGRSREFQWPGEDVRPRLVLDLNYADDSPGLEWAVARGLPYQSGLRMFKLQAEAQREFWSARKGARCAPTPSVTFSV